MHKQGDRLILEGKKITLKILDPNEVDQYYVEWMKNPEITRYLESRWSEHTLPEIRKYIEDLNKSKKDYLFGIFLKHNNQHIGNIKIGDIDRIHRFANIGLLIGDINCWGKGYGTEAIVLATKIAFEHLDLHCLTAGVYSPNLSSYKAFIKAGWEEAGRYKKYRLFDGSYVDQINVQKCRDTD